MPSLPTLALPQAASEPTPPGMLPRKVAPPSTPSHLQSDTVGHARFQPQSDLHMRGDGSRFADSGQGLLRHSSQPELPPIRDASSSLHGNHSPVHDFAREAEVVGGLRSSARGGTRHSTTFEKDRRDMCLSPADGYAQAHEIEHLKRQAARLAQLRRELSDRDGYIEELLADAEATQRRHETDLARRTSRTQRELSERLATQQREHDLDLEKRNRAHALALAQLAQQHQLEMEDLRGQLGADARRQASDQLAVCGAHFRDQFFRLGRGAEALRLKLTEHAVALEGLPLEGSEWPRVTKFASTGNGGLLTLGVPFENGEPEPEEASACATERLFGIRPLPSVLLGELEMQSTTLGAAGEAADTAERALRTLHEGLCRAMNAGRQVAARLMAESSCKQPLHERPLPDGCVGEKKWRQGMLTTSRWREAVAARAVLSVSFTTWLCEVRLCKSCSQHTKDVQAVERCAFDLREQRRRDKIAALAKESCHWQQIVLRAWFDEAAYAHEQAAHQRELDTLAVTTAATTAALSAQASHRVDSLQSLSRKRGLQLVNARKDHLTHAVVLHWANIATESRCAVAHKEQLDAVVAEGAAQLSRNNDQTKGRILELRARIRSQGFLAVGATLERFHHVVLRSWAASTSEHRRESLRLHELEALRGELIKRTHSWGCWAFRRCLGHHQFLLFRAWVTAAAESRRETLWCMQLEQAAATSTSEYALLQEDTQRRISELCQVQRQRGHRLVNEKVRMAKHYAYFAWSLTVRDKRKESGQRHTLLTVKADHAAEVYRLRSDTKKTTSDLRKQRRAHGVAALHANLDRRLQAVMHAWATIAGDVQREVAYQRQLDIAAAEAAASCAVVRMEGRRKASELRIQRRVQGLTAIQTSLCHWQHSVCLAWHAVVAEKKHQAFRWCQLSIAVTQSVGFLVMRTAEARRFDAQGARWRSARVASLDRAYSVPRLLAAFTRWACAMQDSRRLFERECHARALRANALSVGTAIVRPPTLACVALIRLWSWAAVLQRDTRNSEASIGERETVKANKMALHPSQFEDEAEALRLQLRSAAVWRPRGSAETPPPSRAEGDAQRSEAMDFRQRTLTLGLSMFRISDRDASLMVFAAWHGEAARSRCRALKQEQEAGLERRLVEESRRGAERLVEAEARHRASLRERTADLESRNASLARQHTEATRALILDMELRHAHALKADGEVARAQLALARELHAHELRSQAEHFAALHAAQIREMTDDACTQLQEATTQHAAAMRLQHQQAEANCEAALHAQASIAEVRLADAETRRVELLRAQSVEEVLRIAEERASASP